MKTLKETCGGYLKVRSDVNTFALPDRAARLGATVVAVAWLGCPVWGHWAPPPSPTDPLELSYRGEWSFTTVTNLGYRGAVAEAEVQAIGLANNLAFAAWKVADAGALTIVDVSDPTRPYALGWCDTWGPCYGVEVAGNYAYVVTDDYWHPTNNARYLGGLQAVDLAHPAALRVVGAYRLSKGARDVALSGDYAYIIDDSLNLRVIDVRDPIHLRPVATVLDCGYHVTISAAYAYVVHASGLCVVDIADPLHPQLLARYDVERSADLQRWETVAEVQTEQSRHEVLMADAAGAVAWFWRVVVK